MYTFDCFFIKYRNIIKIWFNYLLLFIILGLVFSFLYHLKQEYRKADIIVSNPKIIKETNSVVVFYEHQETVNKLAKDMNMIDPININRKRRKENGYK